MDTVLILGANGAVGSAAVQLCQALDCQSVLTTSRREGNGADLVLTMEPAILRSKMLELTRDRGVNVVVDTIGDIGIMSMALGWLNARGRYVWIAAPRDGTDPFLSVDILQTYRKELELIGCNSALKTASETKEELSVLAALIQNGRLKPAGHTTLVELSLENSIERGYIRKEPGETAVIKII
ncbi:hypothetical protein E8E13_005411 [Curvularia kusanoi]|uniref:Alcohol dehydrogenase-like C-terminal domain-containing protein n=1 Tax=Curvularia kusanoi TaxID=90978 RepID=A0A9P4THU9_CURKU|nr:hypothetical protein E8E13_005411 [Curvularia kusanoi]